MLLEECSAIATDSCLCSLAFDKSPYVQIDLPGALSASKWQDFQKGWVPRCRISEATICGQRSPYRVKPYCSVHYRFRNRGTTAQTFYTTSSSTNSTCQWRVGCSEPGGCVLHYLHCRPHLFARGSLSLAGQLLLVFMTIPSDDQ